MNIIEVRRFSNWRFCIITLYLSDQKGVLLPHVVSFPFLEEQLNYLISKVGVVQKNKDPDRK